MIKGIWNLLAVTIVAAGIAGCTGEKPAPSAAAPQSDNTYVVSSEPAGAVPVGDARESAKDEDEVVLIGRIGGSEKPFVDGIAAFTIVDPKVPHCSAEEGCATPWDYCCTQDQVKDNIATVKIVDAQGKPLARDARQLLGVKELTTVVIRGKAQRDADGNLAVQASEVFVKE